MKYVNLERPNVYGHVWAWQLKMPRAPYGAKLNAGYWKGHARSAFEAKLEVEATIAREWV